MAAPEGFLRVFVDEGEPMAALLDRLISTRRGGQSATFRVPPDHLSRLVAAFGRQPLDTAPQAPAVPGLVEALTDRQLDVLRLLAAGLTNAQIATELVVSLHTVKKHVTHVLRKLGAGNRTAAVARARELGLVP
jgi:LuxR family maltose regulon positive regulatory protein